MSLWANSQCFYVTTKHNNYCYWAWLKTGSLSKWDQTSWSRDLTCLWRFVLVHTQTQIDYTGYTHHEVSHEGNWYRFIYPTKAKFKQNWPKNNNCTVHKVLSKHTTFQILHFMESMSLPYLRSLHSWHLSVNKEIKFLKIVYCWKGLDNKRT